MAAAAGLGLLLAGGWGLSVLRREPTKGISSAPEATMTAAARVRRVRHVQLAMGKVQLTSVYGGALEQSAEAIVTEVSGMSAFES